MGTILGVLLMIIAIPVGLYMWLKWGWYDGIMLMWDAFNTTKSGGDFAWGLIKFMVGGAVGAICGWVTFFAGALVAAASD